MILFLGRHKSRGWMGRVHEALERRQMARNGGMEEKEREKEGCRKDTRQRNRLSPRGGSGKNEELDEIYAGRAEKMERGSDEGITGGKEDGRRKGGRDAERGAGWTEGST